MTGIDSSPAAIKIANENPEKRGVTCRLITGDLLGDLHEIRGTFDFGFDWELLHTIYPEDRGTYVKNLCRLLNTGTRYLSVAFPNRTRSLAAAVNIARPRREPHSTSRLKKNYGTCFPRNSS